MRHLRSLYLFASFCWLAGTAMPAAYAQGVPAFEVSIRDGVFAPKRIEVPAGQRVKLVLKNEGPGPLEFENADMHIEKILGAGGTSFVVLPKLAPGEYEFVDEFNMVTGVLSVIVK